MYLMTERLLVMFCLRYHTVFHFSLRAAVVTHLVVSARGYLLIIPPPPKLRQGRGMASHDYENVKQRIISSALARRNVAGGPPERYVAHLSTFEDGEGGQPKPRYTILSGA